MKKVLSDQTKIHYLCNNCGRSEHIRLGPKAHTPELTFFIIPVVFCPQCLCDVPGVIHKNDAVYQ